MKKGHRLSINWLDTPLKEFLSRWEPQENGTGKFRDYPHGQGEAQDIMIHLGVDVGTAYERLLGPQDFDPFETEGKVPVIRDGQRGYEDIDRLTLNDLPVVLETLVMLEQEHAQRQREESERKKAERQNRERVRAKERRKLKKLGEW